MAAQPGFAEPDFKTRALTVLWPAFVMAGVLEMLVFALVDPQQLHGWAVDAAAWPRAAVYTLAFFVFWLCISGASAVSVWLATPEHRTD
jgi:hypothetical protein